MSTKIPAIQEELDSRQMSIEKGGKRTMTRSFLVPADSSAEAVIQGPPYGSGFGTAGVYLKSKSVARVDAGLYRLKANYESPDAINNPPVDYVFWDVDIATQTQKIYNIESPSDRTEYPSGSRFAGRTAINEDDEENIDGVDVLLPKIQLTARVLRKKKYWTTAYQQTVYGLVAHVNDDSFMGFEAGEVMFMGCQKSDSGEDFVNLTFQFMVEKNVTAEMEVNVETEGTEVSVEKQGWQYLWARIGRYMVEGVGDNESDTVKNGVLTVNVDTLYSEGDFSQLGLSEADSEVTDDTDYGIL